MKFRASCFLLFFFLVSACGNDDFLDGYSRGELFASPTQEEIDAVGDEWGSRDLSANAYEVVQSVQVTENGAVLRIVSFMVRGLKEYGALLIPASDVPMPVRMFIGGFGKDLTTNSINLEYNDNTFDKPFVFAIPALRGQSLYIKLNGVVYTTPISEGFHCDAFDGATDDAIAFLNIIEGTEELADTERVAVRGGSRGGAVALLMAERDKRIKMAISVAGPTDLVELTSHNENDATYQCQFLSALVNKVSSIHQVRQKMIASSPLFFAKELPLTQLHLAANDKIVPVSQGELLKSRMSELGRADLFEMFVYENRDHSNIVTDNTELESRIELLLSQL